MLPESCTAAFTVAPDEPVLAGHFPDKPILPGVLTLSLVRATLARATGRDWRLVAVERMKLVAPVLPPARVAVSCRVQAGTHGRQRLECRLGLEGGGAVASARVEVEPV